MTADNHTGKSWKWWLPKTPEWRRTVCHLTCPLIPRCVNPDWTTFHIPGKPASWPSQYASNQGDPVDGGRENDTSCRQVEVTDPNSVQSTRSDILQKQDFLIRMSRNQEWQRDCMKCWSVCPDQKLNSFFFPGVIS